VRPAFQSPIKTILQGLSYWRAHGSRVRRARILCQCGDTLRVRRVRGFEQRAPNLYRKARRILAGLADPGGDSTSDPGVTAHQALSIAQRPYRAMAQAALPLGLALAVGVFLALVVGSLLSTSMCARFFPRDLAAGRPWLASNADHGYSPSGTGPSSDALAFFHTSVLDRPWVEIDLGSEHIITGVMVENRKDCCKERALPLNFEVFDGQNWQLVVQRRTSFTTWTCDFEPVRARKVRLLRPGQGYFHLRRISVYGR
jgi:hypothetical protein